MITKNITMGIFAHVDSGKTTLAEAILYQSGSITREVAVVQNELTDFNYNFYNSMQNTIFK